MKRIINIFMVLSFAISLISSCKIEEADLFPTSASERMENRIVEYRELLSKPEHGWLMKYYPGGSIQSFGGFALTVKFTKAGECYFQSILSSDLSEVAKSQYSLKKDVGPTLNFDIYNDLFHYFSSPDINEGQGEGSGYLGDYEFVLGEINDDGTFTMKGKKHGNLIKMSPLTVEPTEYLTKAKSLRDAFVSIPGIESVSGTIAGKEISGRLENLQTIVLSMDNISYTIPFMFTDKGLELYREVRVDDKIVKDLNLDMERMTIRSSDNVLDLHLNQNPKALRLEDFLGRWTLS